MGSKTGSNFLITKTGSTFDRGEPNLLSALKFELVLVSLFIKTLSMMAVRGKIDNH
jgi:hypothetical protein